MSIGGISGIGGGGNFPSPSEMRQIIFNKMDQDGDGVISKSEFDTDAEKRAGKTGQSLDADKIFAAIDTNKDGVIDKSENDAALESMFPPPPPPPPASANGLSEILDKIFAAMDTNKDGVIDKSEYEAAMEQMEAGRGSGTASVGSNDSSTSGLSSTDESAETKSESSLLALIQQLIENLLHHEKYQSDYATSESKDTDSVDSYA